ncbi:hypothetical protein ETU09_00115 [Apibacter muscae]|uniref:DUF304 domain-containing protein n=1 Tax=Apibacter muscae TaxID=2509004 RepID=A0A563DLW4_9FLAO|nr:hypothetical protein [Apibacter muscae]TWP30804.1 hypothetical protein ETU09_00115 [Apibacter muscae]
MKEYKFYGVDFKTELKLGIIVGLIFIILWPAFIFFYYKLSGLEYLRWLPKSVFFGAMFFSLAISLTSLFFLGKRFKQLWGIDVINNSLVLKKNELQNIIIKISEIKDIMFVANKEMRYLRIRTFIKKKYKIRVSTSPLAPFSTSKDLSIIDRKIVDIEKELKKYNFHFQKGNNQNKIYAYLFTNNDIL